MPLKTFLLSLSLLSATSTLAQQYTLSSPDNKITCHIRVGKKGIEYQVALEKTTLIDWSGLRLTINGARFSDLSVDGKVVMEEKTERYDLLAGKASHVVQAYKVLRIPLRGNAGIHINLIFRALGDAIAFRYEFVKADNKGSFILNDERDEFKFKGNPIAKVLPLPNYQTSHEGHYTTAELGSLPEKTLFDMPALFQFASGEFVSITEAALLDYAGMYLMKEGGVLRSKLSPSLSDSSVKVRASFPHVSPWRVIMVSKNVGDFISSTTLTTLCPPNRITDTGWLKPGKTTFPWWNGNVTNDTLNAPGNNFITQKFFIDWCSKNHIEYHSVVEYGLHQWYTDDGINFQPGPHPDVTQPVPGLNMKEVCDYAHSKNVGIRVWVHWGALYPKLDAAFHAFQQWGLSGMMIDFMDRDDQEMVNIQTEMLEKAAAHHLHIQFHGAYKPTGLSRTYPNEFTREGTLNYETNKWDVGLSPEHDLDIAFTRLIAGSTDYHLGGFRAVPKAKYRVQYTRPLMLGTRCHMLGMFVVLENAVGMVCDYPDAYEGQPGFEFIQQVPTTWDETKVLQGKPGEYLIVARRKGTDWYLGAINNSVARAVTIPLSFLSIGNYQATTFEDIDSANNPDRINKQESNVSSNASLSLKMAGGGGAVVRLALKK